jgi:hypothetical protein
MPRQTARPRSLSPLDRPARRARRIIAALALTVAGLAIAVHARKPAPAVDVVCDTASWTPLDEPRAFPADRAQLCHLGTVDGPIVRVVDLD